MCWIQSKITPQLFRYPLYDFVKRLTTALLGAAIMITPILSYAHPHSWMEIKTYIEGTQNTITGFKMEWTFDAMTSAYMLDGEDLSPKNKANTMQKVADSVMTNMLDTHYFTYFYDDQTPIKYKIARAGQLTQKKAKLMLSFELPLSKPKPLTASTLKLRIFEPSYYIDMSWIKENGVTLSPELAKTCSVEIIEPNPTPEQISYAISLPIDADPDNELGQLFTQTIQLHCRLPQVPKEGNHT